MVCFKKQNQWYIIHIKLKGEGGGVRRPNPLDFFPLPSYFWHDHIDIFFTFKEL